MRGTVTILISLRNFAWLVLSRGFVRPLASISTLGICLRFNVTILVLLFSVLIVVVNILCTLIVAVLTDYIKR
jgi:hypothetical protein